METNKLFEAIDNELADMILVLSSFSEDQVNLIPFKDSWTPGQVVQHVLLSDNGFFQQLTGSVKDTERPADQFVANLRDAFLNYDIKMKSPDFITPAAVQYNKEELLNKLCLLRTDFGKLDRAMDMTKTCTLFEIPTIGFLTRNEIAHFAVYHTRRHVHQLKKIHLAINEKVPS